MKLEWSKTATVFSQFSKWFAEGSRFLFMIVHSPDQRFWCSCKKKDTEERAIFKEGFHTIQAAKDKCQEAEDALQELYDAVNLDGAIFVPRK